MVLPIYFKGIVVESAAPYCESYTTFKGFETSVL